ncbi:AlpA family transcriptional regulator [Parafrankia sp. EUN1f]|uniref:helix-turn-helix transcriptional regulator n=1 Tax=Parafrankia sp. EUN1f TaxID=102897 RepID=UPI0001C46D01|nr:hypothetical protein [Parafrankia sp. EUN1f]EFC80176.1 hypothetical protein FrEUN1fDRAFT_6705 [Parafrankia sp. EUN1f]
MRILITTATGREVAAGGKFADEAAARAWAEAEVTRYAATVGDVVDEVPPGALQLSAALTVRQARADQRDHAATQPPPPLDGPDRLLDLDEVAERYGMTPDSARRSGERGTLPEPDEGSGRTSRWRLSTLALWDHEAPLRRSR